MELETEMAAAGARILMVDDDPGIRDVVSDFLGRHGYQVETAADAGEMERVLERGPVDLIVLHVMLPGEDGLAVCRRMTTAENAPPISMLSAMGEDTDRIVGLELGADDYLPKPFEPRELLARIRAILRRAEDRAPAAIAIEADAEVMLAFDGWTIQPGRRQVLDPSGRPVDLTGGEFDLVVTLAERPQRVLSRDRLLDLTKGRAASLFDRSVDVQIGRLRRKLEAAATGGGALIATVRGGGYMFTAAIARTGAAAAALAKPASKG